MSKFTAAEVKNKVVVIGNGDSSCFYTTSGVVVGDQIAAENMKSLDGVMLKIEDIVQISSETEYDVVVEAEAAEKAKNKAKIVKVVEEAADIDAMMTGRISFLVKFEGSVSKTKKLTSEEAALVMSLPPEVKSKIKGEKTLFVSKEYDELMGWIGGRRDEFKRMGIPDVMQDACTVINIMSIPDVEALAEKTEAELPVEVAKFAAVYPAQVEAQREILGPLFNPKDYRPVEALQALYKFRYVWLGYGAMEALKQTNVAYYKKALKQAEEVWAEVEANGVALLRQTVNELVSGLAESLAPKADGTKKKFFNSSVEKIKEFAEDFAKRNVCNDAELDKEVQKLRKMVEGIDVNKLSAGDKGDEALREKVRKQMEEMKKGLGALLVDASTRLIKK